METQQGQVYTFYTRPADGCKKSDLQSENKNSLLRNRWKLEVGGELPSAELKASSSKCCLRQSAKLKWSIGKSEIEKIGK